jgi:hypothetical protein
MAIRERLVRKKRQNKEDFLSSMIYLIYCNNICKCYNTLSPSTTIKKKKKKVFSPVSSYGRKGEGSPWASS